MIPTFSKLFCVAVRDLKIKTPIEFLRGVGPARAAILRSDLNIHTFEDLLGHYPYRYFDRSEILSINQITEQSEWIQLIGTITNIGEEGDGPKRRLLATLYDQTGRIELLWFQGRAHVKKTLQDGVKYLVFGKVSFFNGRPNIAHPEIELYSPDINLLGRQPVYSSTQKLISRGITNRSFSKLTQALFQSIQPEDIPEFLPERVRQNFNLLPRAAALADIHFPQSEAELNRACHRLKWEELFASQLMIALVRQQHAAQVGWKFERVGEFFNEFYSNHLPFQLTNAQQRVVREIRRDTISGRQMNRLLQGDVGSGKTIVALMCALLAIDNGFQACIMAPTEILARQHFEGISSLLRGMNIPVGLLTGTVKGKERKLVLEGIKNGSISLAIGTHAMIEDTVHYKNLGLAVIDEQHRFGVSQRAKLWKKNTIPPHILVMTATPIPRTLAMTLYGDLEVSIIDELPPGRKEILTLHRLENQRARVMQFVKTEIEKGRQAYIVYPLIEESEKLDYESLLAGYEQVRIWFPDHQYNIAMVHGRQPSDERQRNMERFITGKANILVATTVIEVGVNVPNASVMVVESAERFGLSQLHQLRGRVGRGAEQSYCILLSGEKIGEDSRQRMKIMCESSNGFYIAEEDLRLRGGGDLYGTRQSGALKFKLADILKDSAIMEETRIAAQQVAANDPHLQLGENQCLKSLLDNSGQQSYWSKIS